MKALRLIGVTALFLALGSNVPAFAQEHQEEAKPEQHEEQAKPARQQAPAKAAPAKAEAAPRQAEQPKSAKQEAQPKPARQETAAKPPQERTQAKAATQPRQAKPEQRQEQAKSTKPEAQTKPVGQEARSSTAAQQHPQRTAAEEQKQGAVPTLRLSANNSGRIPDDRFRARFGREHEFSIGSPTMVDGYSRFRYGGYWFGFVQPWPVGWYYTDNVYVEYVDGGYYLCNPYYPDARIEISIVG